MPRKQEKDKNVPKPPSLSGESAGGTSESGQARDVFVVDPAAQARKQYGEEARYLAANPLDETEPGGYFIDVDGKGAHNAAGQPVELRGEDKEHAEFVKATYEARREAVAQVESAPEDSPEELAERQRQSNRNAAVAARARGEPVTVDEETGGS